MTKMPLVELLFSKGLFNAEGKKNIVNILYKLFIIYSGNSHK